MPCNLLKNYENTKKYNECVNVSTNVCSKVPTDDCYADLLLGDSALLLYYSESRTRSRNSTVIPIFTRFVFSVFSLFYICVCRSVSKCSGNGKLELSEVTITHDVLIFSYQCKELIWSFIFQTHIYSSLSSCKVF